MYTQDPRLTDTQLGAVTIATSTLWLIEKPESVAADKQAEKGDNVDEPSACPAEDELLKAFDFDTCKTFPAVRALYKFGGLRDGVFRGFRHLFVLYCLGLPLTELCCFGLWLLPTFGGLWWSVLSLQVGGIFLCIPMQAAATQSIVSRKRMGFLARIPPVATWKHLYFPAVVLGAGCSLFVIVMVAILLLAVRPSYSYVLAANEPPIPYPEWNVAARALLLTTGQFLFLSVAVNFLINGVIPVAAYSILRAHICLLPPDEDTIIPVDRSAGGLATPMLFNRGDEQVELFVLAPSVIYNGWARRLHRCFRRVYRLSNLRFIPLAVLYAAFSLWRANPLLLDVLLRPHTPQWVLLQEQWSLDYWLSMRWYLPS